LSVARAAHAAGAEKFRVAIVGAGGRGTGAAADCLNVAKHIALVAIGDAFTDRAQTSLKLLREQFPGQVDVPADRIWAGLDAYRKVLACDADLVILAAPPGFRPAHYRAAVAAGKHVFMEKPLCVDAPGFRSVMETNQAADQRGLRVGVGLFRRHNPAYIAAIQRLRDGQIGPIKLMRCTCNMTAWGGVARKPGMSELEYQLRCWRCSDWLSGGRLVEAHCHELDVMDWAMDAHPVEANGMGGRQVCTEARFAYDYDHHFHEYTYADGTKMYSQNRSIDGVWQDISEHIHGTKGVIDLSGKILKINEWRRERINPYYLEHRDLLDAIWSGKPYNEGWFGATSSFTAILGREAGYSGQIVEWDELAARGRSIFPEKELTFDDHPPAMPNPQGNYNHLVAVPGVYQPF
jgi:hypothetical protein